MFKTEGQEMAERKERIVRLKSAPETANSDDVKWLILQIEIEERKIPNHGYYC